MSYLLSIDSGTNACKVILFDLEGRLLSSSTQEHPINYPKPTWAEQDPEWWWLAAVEAIKTTLKNYNIDPRDIAGIGVDSQREAVVPLNKKGKCITNSIIWLDRRSIPQAEKIKDKISQEEVLSRTGVPIDYFFSAAKLLWIKDETPHQFSQIKKILFPKDYIVYKLTGEVATDYSMASRTMLFNIHKRIWDEEICKALDIPIDLLPPVKGAWEVVGEVHRESADATGLKPETPVVSGGGDRPCEALGAGVYKPGRINIGTGTGTTMTIPLREPIISKDGKVDCCYHVVPDTWEYELHILTTGASLRWFRDNFTYEEVERSKGRNAYDYLVDLASKVPLGSDNLFYYPYPMGAKAPKYNDLAKAVFFGFTLSHTKAHFVRAIMEGVAFQYAEILDLVRNLGIELTEATIVGGEAKSDLWNQIKADVTGLKVWVPEVPDAAALGSAILAGIGGEAYKDVSEAVERAVRFRKCYNPNLETTRHYRIILDKYRKVYEFFKKGYPVIA